MQCESKGALAARVRPALQPNGLSPLPPRPPPLKLPPPPTAITQILNTGTESAPAPLVREGDYGRHDEGKYWLVPQAAQAADYDNCNENPINNRHNNNKNDDCGGRDAAPGREQTESSFPVGASTHYFCNPFSHAAIYMRPYRRAFAYIGTRTNATPRLIMPPRTAPISPVAARTPYIIPNGIGRKKYAAA